MKIAPRITRIVPGRELRWFTQAPDPSAFSAEHIFRIEKKDDSSVTFHNDEIFRGSLVEERWPGLNTNTRAAYEDVNRRLATRAEEHARRTPALHPVVDGKPTGSRTAGLQDAVLRCACSDPVEVTLSSDIAHNHLCGCSQCWKPEGATLAQTAVVPSEAKAVSKGKDRLKAVDARQKVLRYACQDCGVHMYGETDDPDHHFYGLAFVHPELAKDRQAPLPEFAGFVSSLVESGLSPTVTHAVRTRLAHAGIPTFDQFSPEIMDLVAWHRVKLRPAA
jgi:S-(hydroxymethyl)glutathione synthase